MPDKSHARAALSLIGHAPASKRPAIRAKANKILGNEGTKSMATKKKPFTKPGTAARKVMNIERRAGATRGEAVGVVKALRGKPLNARQKAMGGVKAIAKKNVRIAREELGAKAAKRMARVERKVIANNRKPSMSKKSPVGKSTGRRTY